MKRMMLVSFLAATGCVYTRVDERPTVTVEDVIRMSAAGVDQGTLLARVQTSRMLEPVTADDIIRMKNEKVPDPVIQAMADAGPRPVTVIERPVYVPSFSFHYGYGHPYRYRWHPYTRYGYRPYGYYRPRPRYYHAPR